MWRTEVYNDLGKTFGSFLKTTGYHDYSLIGSVVDVSNGIGCHAKTQITSAFLYFSLSMARPRPCYRYDHQYRCVHVAWLSSAKVCIACRNWALVVRSGIIRLYNWMAKSFPIHHWKDILLLFLKEIRDEAVRDEQCRCS